MLGIHVKLGQKFYCCFYGNNHYHISELVNANNAPMCRQSGDRICRTLGKVFSDCMLRNKKQSF